MYCHKCGKKLEDGAKFCPDCGTELISEDNFEKESTAVEKTQTSDVTVQPVRQNGKKVKCPVCGSKNLQVISEDHSVTQTKGGGYSGTKGCLGYLLLGPFGLLCGSCGQKEKTKSYNIHKTFWVCSDCGHKFRNLEDWKKEIDSNRNGFKILVIFSAVLLVLSIFALIMGTKVTFALIIGIFCLAIGIAMGVCAVVTYFSIKKAQKEYEELERASTES